ncbi:hypothetical protein LPJ78_005645 [Coemansia sp. RSA 989]|nr:hypothetical protein BX667DRAFT_500449 [Coemansia mojavensis]KAJ1748535.1 hypothetical protein LPJ79_004458 [Coemansia sp. RSA 1821]KAJ1860885.1 hypothetical protein LPJ78_005645 [Coemansia sp. RSA 989]KAJ2673019.1 hypothetical protein IWW42_002569 [Coemansia sp. RSA 1085]
MSLSRLPQVALRRLFPAITAVPKSLDDDQLKKMMEPQQSNISAVLQSKLEFSNLPLTTQQGLISALAKSVDSSVPSAIGRLLVNLSGSQGMLSSQDLALIKAAKATDTSGASNQTLQDGSQPASPMESLPVTDSEPQAGALDAASVDALVKALRGTAAISSESTDSAALPPQPQSLKTSKPTARGRARRVSEPASAEHSEDEDTTPISAELSAAERRKEQNRRAQKKFRQKDKVRQKEIKWRASQYDELVESNKRFKRDIDAITRERDQYRRILESHGIKIDTLDQSTKIAKPASTPAEAVSPATTMVSPDMSPQATPLGMEQIAQDTFGQWMPSQPTSTMNELLNSLAMNAVKADPMFGSSSSMASTLSQQPLPQQPQQSLAGTFSQPAMATEPISSSETQIPLTGLAGNQSYTTDSWLDAIQPMTSTSDPLLMESPLVVDQNNMDPQYMSQTMLGSQLVDPSMFMDEFLSSSAFSGTSVSRKRSYDDAMF